MNPLKVRKIEVNGSLKKGVTAKDIILYIIATLGVKGGVGYAYEYGGTTVENLSIEERMTICNMSIEGGARVGYVNPDEKTFAYLKGRPFAPKEDQWEEAIRFWKGIRSDPDASYDDIRRFSAEEIEPMVTWGINPGQAIPVTGTIPSPEFFSHPEERKACETALKHMGFRPGEKILGKKIDVAFIGSCTNARLPDLRMAAEIVKGKKIKNWVKGIVVPGSLQVKKKAEEEGLDEIFREAGFEWRGAGCSLCLGMNEDKLTGDEVCASSSNRNFIGRQGSPKGRTLLMSPIMVAASAIEGHVVDVREYLS
jgi:3-isopropylmalate/(R)-2-methylmalate dehydratase large subunit